MADRAGVEAFLEDIADLGAPGAVPRIERTGDQEVTVRLAEAHRDMVTVFAALHGLDICSIDRGTGYIAAGGLTARLVVEPRTRDRARAFALALSIALDASIRWPERGDLDSYAPGIGRSVRILLTRGQFNAPVQTPTPQMEILARLLEEQATAVLDCDQAEEDTAAALLRDYGHLLVEAHRA